MASKGFNKRFEHGYVYYIHGRKNEIYVGCTTQPIKQRLMHAYVDYKTRKPNLSSSEIFHLNGVPCDIPIKELDRHVEIVVLQEFENISRKDLCKFEAFWIFTFGEICVNNRRNNHLIFNDELQPPVYDSQSLEWTISI